MARHLEHCILIQAPAHAPLLACGARAGSPTAWTRSAARAHACCAYTYRRHGQSPETPAVALVLAHAAGARSQTLMSLSFALLGLSSLGSTKLCGHPWVRAVACWRLCDTHTQQASPWFSWVRIFSP